MEGKPPPLTTLQAQGQVLDQHSRLLSEASIAVRSMQKELREVSTLQQSQATQQQAQVNQLTSLVKNLTDQVAALCAQLTTSPGPSAPVLVQPSPAPSREPHLNAPAPYDGTFSLCREFLMQCEYVFDLQPSMYSTSPARIAYITNLTTGRARRWIFASREGSAAYMQNYKDFVLEFKAVFDHDVQGQDADTVLSTLRQGSSSVADYATEFRILAARCDWNEPALLSAFLGGLSESTKDALAERERPSTLSKLISLSISIDERHRERKRERASQYHVAAKPTSSFPTSHTRPERIPSAVSSPTEEDCMQLGRIRVTSRGRLSPAERRHRRLHGLCLYCAASAHTVHSCPILRSKVSSSRTPGGVASPTQGFRVSRLSTPQPFTARGASFPVTLTWEGQSLTIPAFIDSGADESFIDLQFALKFGLPVSALQRPLPAFALNGHALGPVTHRTQPLTLTVSGDHVESIRPYVTHSPGTPFILGRPWLELHTPHVCWSSGRILSWSAACQVCCLQPARPPPRLSVLLPGFPPIRKAVADVGHTPTFPVNRQVAILGGGVLLRLRLHTVFGHKREPEHATAALCTPESYTAASRCQSPHLVAICNHLLSLQDPGLFAARRQIFTSLWLVK